MINYVIND